MLYVPYFSHNIINTIFVHHFLALVHDGCLWLGGPIPIDNMLIHRIIALPYQGANLAYAFVGKSQEKNLTDQMKSDFRLVNKSQGYLISSISNEVVQFDAKILARKIMHKYRAHEVPAPVVSLAMQCNKGVQFNWAKYLCKYSLDDFCEVQEEGKGFHYMWLLLLITPIAWRMPEDSQFPTTNLELYEAAKFS